MRAKDFVCVAVLLLSSSQGAFEGGILLSDSLPGVGRIPEFSRLPPHENS